MKNKLRVNSFSSGGQAGCSKGMTDSPFTFFYSDIKKTDRQISPWGKYQFGGSTRFTQKSVCSPNIHTYIE